MRVVIVALVVACSAPAKRSAAPAEAPVEKQRDLAVAEPPPKQPTPPPEEANLDPRDPRWIVQGTERQPNVNEVILRRREMPEPIDQHVAESDLWSPCVRAFVHAQNDHAKRALTTAFSRYVVTCDAQKRVVVSPPHEVRGKPFLAYSGTFVQGRQQLVLQAATCGARATIDRVVIVYDGRRWSSHGHTTERRDGCTIASVIDQRSLRRVLRDVIDARDAAVMFEGVEDVIITDEMKLHLRLMLDALDALAA